MGCGTLQWRCFEWWEDILNAGGRLESCSFVEYFGECVRMNCGKLPSCGTTLENSKYYITKQTEFSSSENEYFFYW